MLWVSDGKTCLPCAWHPEHSCSSTTNVSRKRLSKRRTQELKSLGDLTANIRWKRLSNMSMDANGRKLQGLVAVVLCAVSEAAPNYKRAPGRHQNVGHWATQFRIQRSKRSESHLSDQGWDLGRFRCLGATPCNMVQQNQTVRLCLRVIIEGSLEVKLPTIWTVEKQRWEESEEKRSEERRCRCAKR